MKYIKGFTFGFCAPRGSFKQERTKESLRQLKERTNISHVIFCLAALQDTAQSVVVDYNGPHIVGDDELTGMINYAKSLGLKVILKPLVNVRNGTWRAHINFFDVDVPCEPKWHEWFASYTAYQCHYAKIAEETGCEMLVVGCEMVQTDRRADQWRALISEVRTHYTGLITYNADKYQEANITWWDAVDVISSSGYYPSGTWDAELDRIEAVVTQYDKPFFFAEAGCSSKQGAEMIPNDWSLIGKADMKVQADYYKEMFAKTSDRDWVAGFGLWDWSHKLYDLKDAKKDDDYAVYGKTAEKVIKRFYAK